MHISEGVLSTSVLLTGALLTAGGTYVGLKRLSDRDIPKVGVLSSAFFVASLIHVPLGPTSVHLILNGLNGLLLGWSAFPSILVALFLQGVLFQFGGLTTLGVNTFNMAFPAVLSYLLFKRLALSGRVYLSVLGGFLTGSVSVALSGLLVALSLALTGQGFLTVAKLTFIAHLPIIVIEGVITSMVLLFIKRVNPKVLTCMLLIFLTILLLNEPCLAHRVKTFAQLDSEGKVVTKTYFSSGEGVKGADVFVYDNVKGNLILKGKTDEEGNFAFSPPTGISELKIVVEAELGHRSQVILPLSGEEPKRELSSLESGKGRISEDVVSIIEQKLKPIQESILRIEEKLSKPSMTEIVGGIGYIFGIFGAISIILSRRRGG